MLLLIISQSLCKAAKEGNYEEVKALVKRGAKIDTVCDNEGRIPLDVAAWEGHPQVVKYLVGEFIRRGSVDVKFHDGKTLLHFAAYGGDLKQMKYLVEKGADINAKDRLGRAPLHEAALRGHLPVMKYLIEKGADVNAKYDLGHTPLHLASLRGHLQVST
ncbi:MAG: hypothetical protein GXO39_03195 [Thermotogae bacterium]|nr:hypothetical protein [Thermotogota bacterium]